MDTTPTPAETTEADANESTTTPAPEQPEQQDTPAAPAQDLLARCCMSRSVERQLLADHPEWADVERRAAQSPDVNVNILRGLNSYADCWPMMSEQDIREQLQGREDLAWKRIIDPQLGDGSDHLESDGLTKWLAEIRPAEVAV